MELDYSKGANPLYYQIKEKLKDKIENKEYMPGDILPPEIELQERFNVSRITVRQAINELANEGYLSRTRGKGTVVIANKIEEELNQIMSFTEEMRLKGVDQYTKFAKVSVVKLNKTIAEYLNLDKDSNAYKIERLRCLDDSPLVFFITYIRGDLKLSLDSKQYMGSLYEYLRKNNIQPASIKEYFEAVASDKTISDYLGIETYTPVLKRTRISYNKDKVPLEYTICYYRADKYRYSVEVEV